MLRSAFVLPRTARSLAVLPALLALLTFTACAGNHADREGDAGAEPTYEDRMAEEHADETPTPAPNAEVEPGLPVSAEETAYASLGGVEVSGYYARPEEAAEGDGETLPGVIMIHEWWGLNDNVRAMARRLAAEGYQVLAVDLYGGESAAEPARARELATAARENPDAALENLREARAFLEEHGAPKVGVLGWCFGGGFSLGAALDQGDDLDAAVIFYGQLETEKEALQPLTAPVLGLFGAEDGGIPVESVRAFESALDELGKEASIHVYEGAGHAFANPSGERYQKEAAEDAWDKTLAFLETNLK